MKERGSKLLVLILLIFSGNEPVANLFYLLSGSEPLVLLTLILLGIHIVKKKALSPDVFKLGIQVFIPFVALLLVQATVFGFMQIGFYLKYIMLFIIPLLTLNLIPPPKLAFYGTSVIVALIRLSFVFWIPMIFLKKLGINPLNYIPDGLKFLYLASGREASHLLIFNIRAFESDQNNFLYRNSGMFWEPGAFGGIIVMGILMFLMTISVHTLEAKKYNIKWLSLGLLSTMSTTSLLTIPFLIFIYYSTEIKRSKSYKYYFMIPVILFLFYLFAMYNPAINTKILEQLGMVQNEDVFWQTTRLGTLIYFGDIIIKNPWIGLGFENETLIKALNSVEAEEIYKGLGNGMIIFVVGSGLPFFFYLCQFWFRSLKSALGNNPLGAFFGLFVILILLQGEAWMSYPMVYVFLYLGLFHTPVANTPPRLGRISKFNKRVQ